MNLSQNIFICLANSLTYVFMLALFLKNFSSNIKRKLITWSVLSISSIALFFDFLFIDFKLLHLVILVTVTLSVSFLFDGKWYNHLFLSFIYIAISGVIESLVGAGLSIAFSIDISQSNQGIYYIIGLFISKLVIFLLIICIRLKHYKKMSRALPHSLLLILSFPIASILLLFLQYNFYLRIPGNAQPLSVFFIICYSLMILANLLLFYIIDSLQEGIEKETEIKAAENIIQKQSEQYSQLLEHKDKLLEIRHNQKNFILGISSAIKNGNYDEALSHLNQEYETINRDSHLFHSEANIIYSIINSKNDVAKKNNVEIDFSYRDMKAINISHIDFAIILGNILDNAIEACSKVDNAKRIITVYLDMPGENIILNVKNPTTKDVDTTSLKTTKNFAWQHGFGIISTKSLVKKYNGEIAFSCKNKEFQAAILLNNLAEI